MLSDERLEEIRDATVISATESVKGLIAEVERLRATLQTAREALGRHRQGMQNILEFRKITAVGSPKYVRYGALTGEEVEESIAGLDKAITAIDAVVPL